MEFSDQDRRILNEVQRDSNQSLAEIAERCDVAQSTLWRRMQEFQASGLIRKRVALLDPAEAGVGLCVFATISLRDHSEASVASFARIVDTHPEIQECHAVTGTTDYIVKIRTRDVESYEQFMTHALLRSEVVREVQSSFSLKRLKETTELPL